MDRNKRIKVSLVGPRKERSQRAKEETGIGK